MKKIILLFVLLLNISCSSEIASHGSLESANRAGVTAPVERSSLSRRIESFAVKHGADPKMAPELADLLAECEHPRLMAAVAARESHFNPDARGTSGEIGMYRVIPKDWGHPGHTVRSQTKKTEEVLRKLIKANNGKLHVTLAKYNAGRNWFDASYW